MKALCHLIIPILSYLLASCSSTFVDTPHNEFKSSETFPKSHAVYKNEEILENSDNKATKLVIDKENTIDGLVQTLTQYMRKTKFKGHYRLEPLNGKLFAIKVEEVSIPEPEPEVWDLYGEH